jgi:MFS family permease
LEEASEVLKKLGHSHPVEKVAEIEESLTAESAGGRLFQKAYAGPIFFAWAIAMFNQLSGINALMYYAPRIFEMAGAPQGSAMLQSIALGAVNVVGTIVGMSMIDFVGRRKLIIWGSYGYIVSLTIVGWAFIHYAGNFTGIGSVVVLVSLLGFQASHCFSQGAVIWVFISEIFPNTVRAKGQALGSFTHWFMAAVVSWTFPIIAGQIGGAVFFFFAAMMVVQLFWALKLMPETKGRALESIHGGPISSAPEIEGKPVSAQ